MFIRNSICVWLIALTASGCAPSIPQWRHDATLMVDRMRLQGAERFLPEEFKSMTEAHVKGEESFSRKDVAKADVFFLLALTKGQLVEERLVELKKRQEEEQRQEAIRKRQLLLQQEMQEELQRRLEKEKALQAEAEARAQAEIRKKADRPRPVRERPLPTHHTAKRGETLPLIAAQADVYNDPALWPLLYRANRDQIKDPRHIWPGQVLRIPRNASREDLAEARRYSQEHQIY
jgi:nucleoid-associated protein YgaU